MGDVLSLQRSAEKIADDALRQTMGDAEQSAMLAEAMTALVRQAQEAQETRNGRELAIFEKDPRKIGRLVDLMRDGNYAETAARLAGLSPAIVRKWLADAAQGDERYFLVADVIHMGEAMAESESVRDVRKAGKDPRNWAASMTFLERRYPSKWGRRPEDSDTPRVIVQIGIADSDVQVHLHAGAPAAVAGSLLTHGGASAGDLATRAPTCAPHDRSFDIADKT